MKRLLILLSLALTLSGPAMAQDGGDRPRGGLEGFLDDLRGGMDDALSDLQGWAETFGPAMRSFIDEMGPALTDMMDEVKDWSRYETPEMLPNGDIIIRRKPDAPETPEPYGRPDFFPDAEPDGDQDNKPGVTPNSDGPEQIDI